MGIGPFERLILTNVPHWVAKGSYRQRIERENQTMKKEYSVKSIAFGIIKVIAFITSVYLFQQLTFIPIGKISARYWSEYDGRGLNEPLFFSSIFAFLLVTIIVCYLFLKFIDKKDWSYLRVVSSKKSKWFLVGLLLSFTAVLLFVAITLVLNLTEINLTPKSFGYIGFYLLLSPMGIFVAVMDEELIARGYVLKTLETHINPVTAIIATSLLFSLAHIFRPNISFIGYLNIFLMGNLLGIVCIVSDSIWLPAGLHFGWNFLLNFLNFPVSGHKYPNPLFSLEYKEYSFISGSKFGPEDSLLITLILIIAVGFLITKFRRNLLA